MMNIVFLANSTNVRNALDLTKMIALNVLMDIMSTLIQILEQWNVLLAKHHVHCVPQKQHVQHALMVILSIHKHNVNNVIHLAQVSAADLTEKHVMNAMMVTITQMQMNANNVIHHVQHVTVILTMIANRVILDFTWLSQHAQNVIHRALHVLKQTVLIAYHVEMVTTYLEQHVTNALHCAEHVKDRLINALDVKKDFT